MRTYLAPCLPPCLPPSLLAPHYPTLLLQHTLHQHSWSPRGTRTWCNCSFPCFVISAQLSIVLLLVTYVLYTTPYTTLVASVNSVLSSTATRGLSNFTPTYIRWLAECLCRLLPCLQCIDQLAAVLAVRLISCDQLRTAVPACSACSSQPLYNTWVGKLGL